MIKLILDYSVVDRYNEYYFAEHPGRRKKPIERPIHESMNKWMIMQRPQMNNLKQRWKEFIIWWIKEEGLSNLRIKNCRLSFFVFMPTRRRSDPDNLVPKFILDGLVDAGLLEDDSGACIDALSISARYDKDNPRTEIVIEGESLC